MNGNNNKTILTIYLDGSTITSIPSFYKQINEQLMQEEDWQLGESLDALDDVLYGKWKDYDLLEIVWKDIAVSERALGIEATKAYYEAKLGAGSPYNQDFVKEKLKQLEERTGQTYFEMVMEIIESHRDRVRLTKKS